MEDQQHYTRILCLADLHRLEFDRLAMQEQDQWIKDLLTDLDPDVVVIAGDVFEEKSKAHPYEELAGLFGGLPVVCTLGNHEFYGSTVADIHRKYRDLYAPDKWNVHYLDIIGAFDYGNLHFFGNVLWYDGSLATVPGQVLTDFAGGAWRDREILDFDPLKEHGRCVQQIKQNQPGNDQKGILCTHCVPHRRLNGHMFKTNSLYNAFSGCSDLLNEISCSFVLCGHTHFRVEQKVIDGRECWNVGSDYLPPFQHVVFEMPNGM